jgi:hypothetical protein
MATLRINGEPGELKETTAPSAAASPVHRNGKTETETEGQGPNHSPARELVHRIFKPSADRSAARALHATSLRFTLVAALSLIEFLYFRVQNVSVAYIAAGTCLIFLALALKASRLHRAGFLTALSVYGISTTSMAVVAMTTEQGIELVMTPLVLHAILIFSLYRNFEVRDQLQLLENKQ